MTCFFLKKSKWMCSFVYRAVVLNFVGHCGPINLNSIYVRTTFNFRHTSAIFARFSGGRGLNKK